MGLGLAIVRRLTRLLEHPISFDSRLGHGSVFKISVPIAADIERPVASPPPVQEALILVVDDEVAICEAMRSLLESWGHQVIVAGSGAEMLRLIADCARVPDLIICDYRLADEGGIAVIQRLQSEFNREIPALLITGDTAPDRLIEARESGFGLLHKPLSADRLQAAIQAVIAAGEDV